MENTDKLSQEGEAGPLAEVVVWLIEPPAHLSYCSIPLVQTHVTLTNVTVAANLDINLSSPSWGYLSEICQVEGKQGFTFSPSLGFFEIGFHYKVHAHLKCAILLPESLELGTAGLYHYAALCFMMPK